jgi:transposase
VEAAFLLSCVEKERDITLAELQRKLAARGTQVGISTLWRFFDRRRITLKKRRRMQPSKTVPT